MFALHTSYICKNSHFYRCSKVFCVAFLNSLMFNYHCVAVVFLPANVGKGAVIATLLTWIKICLRVKNL